MDYRLSKINIKNFRSISNLEINLDDKDNLIIICGANNVGKTNFLRALDLFFSLSKEKFDPDLDIPYHKTKGSRGAGYKSIIEITFESIRSGEIYVIKQTYTKKQGEKILDVQGRKIRRLGRKKDEEKLGKKEIREFLEKFKFIFVESSNVNIPKMIAEIVKEEVLSLGLDKKRASQKESLEKLGEFIKSSKEAVSNIEKDITQILKTIVGESEGIKTENWAMRIVFPEFEYLREAIANMIDFTLYDTNDNPIDSKGSGIQKIILLSLIKYISEKIKKNVIWGIDEPEAFLQPGLQKKLFSEFKKISEKQYVIITTHSHFFVDLSNLKNTFLFTADQELKEYRRRPGKFFYKVNTLIDNSVGYAKVLKIKKHLGIQNNDSWDIMPFNIIVEGCEDKEYLLTLADKFSIDLPNIIIAGGVDKIPGLLSYISMFCEDNSFETKILCILDHDDEGRKVFKKLSRNKNNHKYPFKFDVRFIVRCDGKYKEEYKYEIEDFIYPELIIEAANKFLRKKHYKIIKKNQIGRRFEKAYIKDSILEFINKFVSYNNPDKEKLDFNEPGIKKYLCSQTCDLIEKIGVNEIEIYNKKYPHVKKFIEEIVDFGKNS